MKSQFSEIQKQVERSWERLSLEFQELGPEHVGDLMGPFNSVPSMLRGGRWQRSSIADGWVSVRFSKTEVTEVKFSLSRRVLSAG